MSPLRRDERGMVVSSPLALLSAAAVVLAGVAFVATNHRDEQPARASATVTATARPTKTVTVSKPAHSAPPKKRVHKKPVVHRGETYVEVFNNSGIQGLAGSTAARASGAGWQVVGSDNWYGTIAASTVYYPPRLQAAAKLLGKDLGIERVLPAIDPMSMDRLTVILTADYA